MKLTFDVDSMTLGEVEEFEEITGLDITDLASGKLPSKAILAIVYLSERRENPEYTLDDARAVRVADIQWGAPDPPEPATVAS